jgi:hypothetical protein
MYRLRYLSRSEAWKSDMQKEGLLMNSAAHP